MACQVQRQFITMDPSSGSKKTSRSSRQQQQRQPQVPTAQLDFDYTQTAFDVSVTTAAAASYVMSPSYSYDTFGAAPDMSLYIPSAMPVQSTQVNWASMDAAAYSSPEQQHSVAYSSPEQQSVYLDAASYSETTDEQPQIEIEMVDSKPKARKRPNRYKNAHPIVKERRREQNREAQRKYRERKDQRIVELEELLKGAQKQNETLSQAYMDLQVEHQFLLRQATKSPSEITDDDPGEGPSGANR